MFDFTRYQDEAQGWRRLQSVALRLVVLCAALALITSCGDGKKRRAPDFAPAEEEAPPPPVNDPPVANAGADQTVAADSQVTLDGSASSDPDNDPLTYAWSQTAGTGVILSDATAVMPTFTAPSVDDTLTFELVVNDGTDSSQPDSVTITVVAGAGNLPPTANAGPDQTVAPGAAVTLDGSGSTDPEMDPLTYSWTQTAGAAVTLSDATAVGPSFTAPGADDVLTFELVVNDGTQDSAPDSVTITVQGGGGAVSYANDVHPIWAARNCTVCHGGGSPAGGLDLSGGAAATYAAVNPSQVNLGDPPSSAILTKPLATGAGGTPHGGGDNFADTNDPDYQTILTWIQAGAPNN